MHITRAGPDSFDEISVGHIKALREVVDLSEKMNVLEVGCGIGRDAIPLTQILSPNANYTGIDIIGRSIEWCQK